MEKYNSDKKPQEVSFYKESYEWLIRNGHRLFFDAWVVNDGEWIDISQPIFVLKRVLSDFVIPELSYFLNKESTGVISHSNIKRGQEIHVNDVLFFIHDEGTYSNENNIKNEKFYFYLNNYNFNKMFNNKNKYITESYYGIYGPISHSFSSVTVSRYLPDGSYVKEGEKILIIKEFSTPYDLLSSKDGYINYGTEDKAYVTIDTSKLLYSISKSDEERVVIKYFNIPNIIHDEFSKRKIINWSVVGGYSSFIWSLDASGSISLGFVFHFDERDYIVFSFSSKELMLSKNDKVSFLFENGSIIEFILSQNSYRSTDQVNKVFENRVPISDDELSLFAEERIKFWKVKLEKGGREIIGGSNGAGNYQDSSNLKIVVNKLAREYRSLVKEEISGYSPLTKEMEPQGINEIVESDVCFVYLMNDTVNNIHKIGISNNPSWREKTLQSEKPTIELLVAKKFINRKIASSIERALHDAYSSKRIRGEWFKLDANELNEIIDTLSN